MAFLVATTSLPAVYRLNSYARTTTAGTPHARAKKRKVEELDMSGGKKDVMLEQQKRLKNFSSAKLGKLNFDSDNFSTDLSRLSNFKTLT